MMAGPLAAGRMTLAGGYLRAGASYWLSVFPQVRRESRHWSERARAIPDPSLRRLALHAQRAKRMNVEGAAAFAAFAPPSRRRPLVRALVAFQTAYDYADTLSEQPSQDPGANARQLHRALIAALDRECAPTDYYAHHPHRDDHGYLHDLIGTCQAALAELPSAASVLPAARSVACRFLDYQGLNLQDADGGHRGLRRWATGATPPGSGLHWWEAAAAGCSSLAIVALFGAAARAELTVAGADAIVDAYWPSASALHILLDSVADEAEDAALGQRSLLDYYSTPTEAASRMGTLTQQALRSTKNLPDAPQHAIILAGMVGSYLADPHGSPRAKAIGRAVTDAAGPLAGVSARIIRLRTVADRCVAAAV